MDQRMRFPATLYIHAISGWLLLVASLVFFFMNTMPAAVAIASREERRLAQARRAGDLRNFLLRNSISLATQDNGVGLPREILTRVFGHGFTTKTGGQGVGPHPCRLAAGQMMGGWLRAGSEGPGGGATLILELPLRTAGDIEEILT